MKNIYLVGIKGVGMTALAVYLKEQGHKVWGSDVSDIFPTDSALSERKIKVIEGFKKKNITDNIDLVVTTGSHDGLNNVEVKQSKKQNIPVHTLAEFVGKESKKFKTVIAVCGSHGKTTTVAMIAYIFSKLNLPASHLVGTDRFSGKYGGHRSEVMAGGHFGGYDYLVVEADEYMASPGVLDTPRFMYLSPDIIICTSVDYDHPDVYPNPEALEAAYLAFFQKLDKDKGILIYHLENERLEQMVSNLEIKNKLPYRESEITLLIPGRHNKLNASAVSTLAQALSFNREEVKRALQSFSGASRRFQKIFDTGKIVLYDDYAHHPVEIAATIEGARSAYPNRRLIVIFQSHTYSRTIKFLPEFVESLSLADTVLITDIFASAREKVATVSPEDFVKLASDKDHIQFQAVRKDDIARELGKTLQPNTVIILMGAGNLYEQYESIIKVIEKL